ncbi:MAG: UvrD-helicase domain-containing protein, partial [Patescibacteria group bacterium]
MIDFKNELNDEQWQVVQNAEGPTLVLAGAGSGKTRTIIYRVAYLLERGVHSSNILLVTFTNKAAREMVERLEHILGSTSVGLWSGTFHSVANRLLRTYALLLGFQQNFTILDSDDSTSLIKACIKEAKISTEGRRFPSPRVVQAMISLSRNAFMAL